jgi:hypothetical protein
MTRAKSEIGNEFVTIASKVSKEDKAKIKAIARAFDMTFYELLQSLLLGMLRYFDIGRHSTYDHNCMMDALTIAMHSIKCSYCPLQKKNLENRNIKSAILFIEDSPKNRPQFISVCKNDDGQMMESLNFDKMVADFLGCIDPDVLQRLEILRNELGYFSITHTLHEIIMQRASSTDEVKADIEGLFKDIRIPSGQAVNDDVFYQKPHRTNVDEYTTITPKQTFRADL